MKTIGLIGGIGCASTEVYYDLITNRLREKLGPGRTGYIILYSINEHDIYDAVKKKQWSKVEKILIQAAKALERAGVDRILICSNLFHKFAEVVQENCKVPLIHILVPICKFINKAKFKRVALIGTKLTSLDGFYANYLIKHSTTEKVIVPNEKQINQINKIIFEELLSNKVRKKSKETLIRIVSALRKQGAECLILGCTELTLILSQKDFNFPVLDSTELHATYVAEIV